jgi:hypothetical protein
MKYARMFGVMMVASFFLVSCATTAYVEKDESVNFAKYRTFAWTDTKAQDDSSNTIRTSDLAERNIKQAVNAELAKAGWKESARPDLLLTYDVMVERSTQEINNPVYSRPQTRYFFNPYTRRWNSMFYPSQLMGYEVEERDLREGTITISLIDARTNKTVWQGWTTDEVNSRNLTSKEIQASVKNIFRKFDLAAK